MTGTDWMAYGACTRSQVENLPWTDEDTTAADRARMARVCAACPMLAVCRVYIATHEVTAGFWAGRDRTAWRKVPEPVQDTLPGLELPQPDHSHQLAAVA